MSKVVTLERVISKSAGNNSDRSGAAFEAGAGDTLRATRPGCGLTQAACRSRLDGFTVGQCRWLNLVQALQSCRPERRPAALCQLAGMLQADLKDNISVQAAR